MSVLTKTTKRQQIKILPHKKDNGRSVIFSVDYE